ncbi:polysaccharide deacetylase family protein [Salegentibacter salegens]|uniref:polysaccharide deacetylase family protein n=1 Tax=Salegentibacter salegens TaxID=143223 RepID=UPI000D4643E7|nr:polysaccharide deacetylase family protein [Salegentibacter salegens]PRX39838.1 polysaccharide deacetylase [Salegentibacter salegens]
MKRKFRTIYASLIGRLLIALGFPKKIKRKALRGDFILSIYFHNPDKWLFEFCVKWLRENRFSFLSEDDIIAIANKEIPFPKGGVLLTVDDGWESNEENVIAVAKKQKVPVTIFVTTGAIESGNYWWPYVTKAREHKMSFPTVEELKKIPNIEREQVLKIIKRKISIEKQALDLGQLKKASKSKYIKISAHTANHPILVNCEDEEAFQEIKKSKLQIEEWLKIPVNSFAYPNGDYSNREIEYLKQLNFSSAYTTEPVYLTKERFQKIYQLPRFCVFEDISKAEAICRMTGVWQRFFK